MAVGKNKKLSKGKKGGKRKQVDSMSRKEWYHIKAPSMFTERYVGETLVNKTQGMKTASDALKGRVFEACLADLSKNEDLAFRKMYLRCEDVQGNFVLTNFHGMDFTTDKLRSLVRKWQTTVEASVDARTTDGFLLRLFCIGFTKRRALQVRKTTYAQHSQVMQIRRKMQEIMGSTVQSSDLKTLVPKLITESIGSAVEKACASIFPLQNVFIRKVKVLKTPKIDAAKLMELHGEMPKEDVGAPVAAPEAPMADAPAEAAPAAPAPEAVATA